MKQTICAASDYPLVSVIMPIRNEAAWITQSLSAVLAQDYPPDRIEILIADGSSDDNTIAIVRSIADNRVQVIANPQQNQAAGMNRALKAAKGDMIVRVDGHTVIAPNYVRTCVNALNSSGADNVGGALNPIGIGRMGQVIAAASKSPFAIPTAFRTSQQAQSTDTVYMGAYRRSVFDAVGCFDEAFAVNEDYEFNYRLREAGGHVFFCPQICSEYYGRQSLMALAHQHFRYGFWKPRTVLKHPKSLRLRQLAAPLMVAFLIVGGLLNRFNPAFTPLWLSGIALYLAANLSFSASIAGDKGRWMLPLLPLVFLTVHLAWGGGFWCGLLYHLSNHANAS